MVVKVLSGGKCNKCGAVKEGVQFVRFVLLKTYLCQTCISQLFQQFRKDR